MTTKGKSIKRAAKPKKAAAPAPAKRKRAPAGQPGGMDLLRIADKVGLQQFAAEGFRDRKTRAFAAMTKIEEQKGNLADAPDGQILMIQFIREMKGMSPEEIFYGIDMTAEEAAGEDRELNRLSAAIAIKRKEYGLQDDEDWIDGEAPDDTAPLLDAWEIRLRQLKVAILRHYAENEMADLLENDPKAYADRSAIGWKMSEENHASGKYTRKADDEKTE